MIKKREFKMDKKYFNASSARLMRFLYALGFPKQDFINSKGFKNWRFEHTEDLQSALNFYFYMRNKNREINENDKTYEQNEPKILDPEEDAWLKDNYADSNWDSIFRKFTT